MGKGTLLRNNPGNGVPDRKSATNSRGVTPRLVLGVRTDRVWRAASSGLRPLARARLFSKLLRTDANSSACTTSSSYMVAMVRSMASPGLAQISINETLKVDGLSDNCGSNTNGGK